MKASFAVVPALALAFALTRPAGAAAPGGTAEAIVPLTDLGYGEGVTIAGVAPSVTFDLPRYASLRAAALDLEVHASANADPASTVSVAVNGRTTFRQTLRAIGAGPLRVALPIPPASMPTFAITVSAALRVAGDPCAADAARSLFLHIGRESEVVVRAAPGGTAEAFFRDYRGSLEVSGALDDPELVAVPYRVDRLEPWHRVDSSLVAAPQPNRRTLVLARSGPAARRGDLLRLTPAAFAALPVPLGQAPARRAGSIAFGDLRQNLATLTGLGDLVFNVPLAASVVGGVPQRLRVHAVVAHSALAAGASGSLQVLVNGVLVGARELDRAAGTQTMDVAVPAAIVGPSNNLRILVTNDVPAAVCGAAGTPLAVSLLGTSTFTWSGVERRAPTIQSFLTALHGRVIVLVAPEFTRAAFRVMNELGQMNAAIERLDVAPYQGRIPDGYDAALVFAPPQLLGDYALPIRPAAVAFAVVDPAADGATVLNAGATTALAVLQLGSVRGTPVLAISYHGNASAIAGIESVRAAQLATQVAGVTVIDARGATAYDIGEKLRVNYAGEETPAEVWLRVRAGVACALLLLIAAGAIYAVRNLAGRRTS